MSEPTNPHPGPIAVPPPKRRRGLKIALALSLSLNLLIVGLVAGAILGNRGPAGNEGPGLRALGLGPFVLSLSREDRNGLRERLDPAATRVDRRAIGESLTALQAALRSDPFDVEAAGAALARSRGAAEALQAHGHGALLGLLVDMSPTARADLADRLQRVLQRLARDRGDRR